MESHLSCVLENYACLRDKFRKEFLKGKPVIDSVLELLRRIFILKNVLNLEDLFNERFERALKDSYAFHTFEGLGCQIEKSMTYYWYKIIEVEPFSLSTSVSSVNRYVIVPLMDVHFFTISEEDLCLLIEGCERGVLNLVEEHNKSADTHSPASCDICNYEGYLKSVLDSTFKQVQERGGGFVESTSKATESQGPKATESNEKEKEKSSKSDDDKREIKEDGRDKEEKLREGDEIVQLKKDIAALVREKEEFGTQLEAAQNELALLKAKSQELKDENTQLQSDVDLKKKEKLKLKQKLKKNKQENSALRQEIQDVRREVKETCDALRTEFGTALDSRDNTLSNLSEKLEVLNTEKLECEENYESQIRKLESSLKENVDKNLKLEAEVEKFDHICSDLRTNPERVLKERDEIAGATEGYLPMIQGLVVLMVGLIIKVWEMTTFALQTTVTGLRSLVNSIRMVFNLMLSSSHNSKTGTFKNHKQERLKAAKAEKEFWGKNKNKIKDEIEEREDKPNYVLTYFDRSQKKHMYKLFAGEQEALTWALRNKDRMKKSYPFIRIRTMEEVDELTTTDLMDVKIELLDPSTGKVLCERMGMFDIGADIASFPYDPEIFKQLMNSVKKINDELVPIVYAKLRIDGEELEKIYPIEVESDKDWCNFGIPQMQDSSETTKRRILQRIGQSFGVAVA